MLHQKQDDLVISTRGRGFYELTPDLSAWLERNGLRQGLLTLHLQHTSASLLLHYRGMIALAPDRPLC